MREVVSHFRKTLVQCSVQYSCSDDSFAGSGYRKNDRPVMHVQNLFTILAFHLRKYAYCFWTLFSGASLASLSKSSLGHDLCCRRARIIIPAFIMEVIAQVYDCVERLVIVLTPEFVHPLNVLALQPEGELRLHRI